MAWPAILALLIGASSIAFAFGLLCGIAMQEGEDTSGNRQHKDDA